MFRAQIYHTQGSTIEVCVSAMIEILHLGSTPAPLTSTINSATSTTTGRFL